MRDFSRYDTFLAHSGVELPYKIAEDPESGTLLYFPTLVPEMSEQQHTGGFSYDALPIQLTNPIHFDRWSRGAGWVDAPPGAVTFDGYCCARNVDASWGDRVYLGPKRVVLDTLAEPVTKFYFSPTFGLYAVAGRYLYQWQATEFVEVHDAGAGVTLTDVIEYGNSTDSYLFVAAGDSEDIRYSTDGTTFTSAVNGITGSFFAVRGQEDVEPVLWLCKRNGLIANSVDPITDTEWSFEDQIGLTNETVTGLAVAHALIYVFKEEGVYTFNGVDVGHLLDLRFITQAGSGSRIHTDIHGNLQVNYGNRLLRLDPVEQTTETAFTTNHHELNGTVTGIGGNTLFTFFSLSNAAGDVYLMKGNPEVGAWHPIVYLPETETEALIVLPPGVVHDNPVVLMNTGNDVSRFILPREGLKPVDDPNYLFASSGHIYGSRIDGGAGTIQKQMNGVRAFVQNAGTVKILAHFDENPTPREIATIATDGLSDARVVDDLPFTRLAYRVMLETNNETESPEVYSLMFDNTPMPPRRRAWAVLFDIEDDDIPRGGGDIEPYSYRQLSAHLFAATNRQAVFTDIDGSEYLVKVLAVSGEGVRIKHSGAGRKVAARVRVELAEISGLTLADALIWDSGTWNVEVWGNE